MGTKTIRCINCGAEVVVSTQARGAKYCPECAETFAKAARKAYRERRQELRTGICHRCGVEFTYIYKGNERALCDECKYCYGGRPKGGSKKRITLAQVEKSARDEHMSYGKYQALRFMQRQREVKK